MGDGVLDKEEFVKASVEEAKVAADAKNLFDVVKGKNDGNISQEEAIAAGFSKEEFEMMDTNKDGSVDRSEFVEAVVNASRKQSDDDSAIARIQARYRGNRDRKRTDILRQQATNGSVKKNGPADKKRWTDNFNIIAYKDRTIPTRDLGKLVRSLDYTPTEAEIEDALRVGDPHNMGVLTYDNFIALMEAASFSTFSQEDVRKSFLAFDTDGSGFIDANELRVAMTTLGEPLTDEQVDRMIKKWDKDGDGALNYEEWLAMHVS